jgi:hypothetical protein
MRSVRDSCELIQPLFIAILQQLASKTVFLNCATNPPEARPRFAFRSHNPVSCLTRTDRWRLRRSACSGRKVVAKRRRSGADKGRCCAGAGGGGAPLPGQWEWQGWAANGRRCVQRVAGDAWGEGREIQPLLWLRVRLVNLVSSIVLC